MGMRWRGFRKVRRQVLRRISRRLQELNLASLDQYRDHLDSHPTEWAVLDGFCRISVSRFYRNRGVFDCLRDEVLPQLAEGVRHAGQRALRCWSAGCASGEEPYTLAIVWRHCVEARFPDVDLCIVATDADEHMLHRAREARYPASSLKELPRDWIEAAFRPDGQESVLRDQYRSGVELLRQDVRSEMPEGPFHLVLCRNLVLTYHDEDLQRKGLQRIAERIVAGGILVTGTHEAPPPQLDLYIAHRPGLGIFRRCRKPC
jgi:chemotaxis protein methyltransferase CheR